MREPFCSNCGENLIKEGVNEYFNVDATTKIDLDSYGLDIYGETEVWYETSRFIRYECITCLEPVTEDQEQDIKDFVRRNP